MSLLLSLVRHPADVAGVRLVVLARLVCLRRSSIGYSLGIVLSGRLEVSGDDGFRGVELVRKGDEGADDSSIDLIELREWTRGIIPKSSIVRK